MSEWEVWDEDAERVEQEEEEATEDVERVDEDEEVVDDDEVVVAKPEGDMYELYAWGFTETIPKVPNTMKWLEAVQAYRQYKKLAEEARARSGRGLHRQYSKMAERYEELAKRYGDLAFELCPYKPHKCPLYSFTSKCIVGMEKACRARLRKKPKRVR